MVAHPYKRRRKATKKFLPLSTLNLIRTTYRIFVFNRPYLFSPHTAPKAYYFDAKRDPQTPPNPTTPTSLLERTASFTQRQANEREGRVKKEACLSEASLPPLASRREGAAEEMQQHAQTNERQCNRIGSLYSFPPTVMVNVHTSSPERTNCGKVSIFRPVSARSSIVRTITPSRFVIVKTALPDCST